MLVEGELKTLIMSDANESKLQIGLYLYLHIWISMTSFKQSEGQDENAPQSVKSPETQNAGMS